LNPYERNDPLGDADKSQTYFSLLAGWLKTVPFPRDVDERRHAGVDEFDLVDADGGHATFRHCPSGNYVYMLPHPGDSPGSIDWRFYVPVN